MMAGSNLEAVDLPSGQELWSQQLPAGDEGWLAGADADGANVVVDNVNDDVLSVVHYSLAGTVNAGPHATFAGSPSGLDGGHFVLDGDNLVAIGAPDGDFVEPPHEVIVFRTGFFTR
jgi:hypothetical protein